MVTIVGLVIAAIFLIIISPILVAGVGIFAVLVIAVAVGGLYLAGYLLDFVTLEGLIIFTLVVAGFKFISFLGRDHGVQKNSKRISSVNDKVIESMKKNNALRLTSAKLEIRHTLASLQPAFSEFAKIRKIQKLNKIESERDDYHILCVKRAVEVLREEAEWVVRFLEENLQKYLKTDLIKIKMLDQVNSDMELITNGISIMIFFSDEEIKHLKVTIKVKPFSPHKQSKSITINFQEVSRKDISGVSLNKLIKLIKKDIIKYISKHPKLAERIDA